MFLNWKQFDTFWEALAFMVVKGDEEHLLPLVPAVDDSGPSSSKFMSLCHGIDCVQYPQKMQLMN